MMNWSAPESPSAPIVVSVPNIETLLNDVRQRVPEGRGFAIATLNLDHVTKLRRDTKFRLAYERHSHVTADGRPIVWLSRLAGQSDVRLTAGSEMIDPIAELASEMGARVGFFGATDSSLEGAANALAERYPGLDICFRHSPAMGFDPEGPDADEAITAIGASGAEIVFLAFGAPKQEIFAARAQERLPTVCFVSVGAGLDFISGAQRRAPAFVRAIALEWLWRLIRDPRRLGKRYMASLAAMPGLTAKALATRSSGGEDPVR